MKNLIIVLICVIVITHFTSCEKMMGTYLDKAPGVDVTEDTIFTSGVQVETFVAGTYRYGIHSIFPKTDGTYTGGGYDPTASATDECEAAAAFATNAPWNTGSVTADNITGTEEKRLSIRFKAIRRCNVLIKRIDAVPELLPAYVAQVKGEAKFIIALNYFEMLKRYGGAPIISKKFELTDDFYVPRNTLKETVDYIISNCNEAISSLPDVYSSNMRGRATKGAALMLKAKTLLYAASPIFNTATPFLDMDDPANNKLICYGNYDATRWQLAADAAKAVLDWAPTGGISLITDKGTDKNYRFMSETPDNPEVILANKSTGKVAIWTAPWTYMFPKGIYSSSTWGLGNSMPLNFVKRYEKQDGTPQTWDPVGGTNLTTKYNELDRRFKQSVTVSGDKWNVDYPIMNSYEGGAQTALCYGGQWITKLLQQSQTNANYNVMPNDMIFRLGEAYLDYAEALNEAQGGPLTAAYDAVNTIRVRSGQPILPTGLTQAQFRDRVRNERAIELFFEDHRLWDTRRWLIADQDGIMNGNFYGLKVYLNPSLPNLRYSVYVFEVRTFPRKMYLHPWLRNEVLKGYLVQNPGW
ncbi:MAG: RagB/SusD family nutrient uptake outer membrane protein [Mariniphaga sp.]|nr:RagB/SusD family nutrient uptake outer membrane protein [Mariniphaga sp.]